MGRPEAARARKLNFLVSGNAGAVQKVKPFLTYCGAAGIWEFGEQVAAANVAKLCNNYLIVAAIEAMSEAIELAEKSGINKQQWANMITQTLFSAPVYINYSKLLLEENYLPAGFFLRLGLKDVNLVLQQAQSVAAKMPVAELAKKQFENCMEKGLGEYDWTAGADGVEVTLFLTRIFTTLIIKEARAQKHISWQYREVCQTAPRNRHARHAYCNKGAAGCDLFSVREFSR
jgi:3-hydroxyisobutyrate dehydrogenase-like beta-hydroxyacid dehydrogenase